ncbi:MAG TPA: LuxR C-terminal-related transcriptional regulator [Gracilimonas sp.]|nr:LuxR C-terminal-related transcriptional regulator [Gracilimonas sp.]
MTLNKDLDQAIYSVSEDALRQISEAEHQQIEELIGRINSGLGPFFYLFYDHQSQNILHISEKCEELTGHPPSAWYEHGPTLFTDLFATEVKQEVLCQSDICWQKVKTLSDETKVRSSIVFRFTVQHNEHCRHFLNQHVIVTTGNNGTIKLCLAVFTDISHLKDMTDQRQVFSSVSISGDQQHFVYNTVNGRLIDLNNLTKREKQVLAGYGSGKHTERIADELSISPYTIQTHRSKLYKKTGCKNLAELIHFAHANSVMQ